MVVTVPSQAGGEAGSRLQAVRKGRKDRKDRKAGTDKEVLAAAVGVRVIAGFWHATRDLPQISTIARSISLASMVSARYVSGTF
jgi:hypothetical protein